MNQLLAADKIAMNNIFLFSLWIVALGFSLILYLISRRKRMKSDVDPTEQNNS